MEEKQKDNYIKKSTLLITILSILLVCLSAYIGYDKFVKKNEKENLKEKEETKDKEKEKEKENKEESKTIVREIGHRAEPGELGDSFVTTLTLKDGKLTLSCLSDNCKTELENYYQCSGEDSYDVCENKRKEFWNDARLSSIGKEIQIEGNYTVIEVKSIGQDWPNGFLALRDDNKVVQIDMRDFATNGKITPKVLKYENIVSIEETCINCEGMYGGSHAMKLRDASGKEYIYEDWEY